MQSSRAVYSVGFLIFMNALIFLAIIALVNSLKIFNSSSNAEVSAPPAKTGDRAPSAKKPGNSSRSAMARAKAKNEAATLPPKAAAAGLWAYEGSVARLETHGRKHRFYRVDSSQGPAAKGADIVFDGVREGQTISGQAFLFSETCGPIGYQVKGSVSPDQTTIKLRGKQPRRDAQCNIASYVDCALEFRHTGKL